MRFRKSLHSVGWDRRSLLAATLLTAGLGMGILLQTLAAAPAGFVSGVVSSSQGRLAGAHVRVRATENLTFTDSNGHFTLLDLEERLPVEVAAWVDGYYVSTKVVTPSVGGLTLTLRPYHTSDHPDYAWTNPITATSPKSCENCHPMIMPQWESNSHGSAVENDRFYSLYNGTNLSGTAVVEPGYLLDLPGTAGNCASCHAPGAAVDGYLTTEMNTVRGVITAGIHCDYCHKIGGVYINPASGTVYPNAPGTLSQRLLRPPPGDNIFFGPYDDIPDPDTYLPEISQSQYCAPCHQFWFWGVPIYESYNEWLESPYPDLDITCQDCHMPPNGDEYFASPGVGGLPHPPETIPSHQQLGARDDELLQETVVMTLSTRQLVDQLQVTVMITNTGAGHHVPTDHPGRHLILIVEAVNAEGQILTQAVGPVIPEWGGEQAGLPGESYAKVLRDVETGDSPVVSYWKPSQIVYDNRIPAGGAAQSVYSFSLPDAGEQITVTTRLLFRRTFWQVMDEKGWHEPDRIMETVTGTIVVDPWWGVSLPIVSKPVSSNSNRFVHDLIRRDQFLQPYPAP